MQGRGARDERRAERPPDRAGRGVFSPDLVRRTDDEAQLCVRSEQRRCDREALRDRTP